MFKWLSAVVDPTPDATLEPTPEPAPQPKAAGKREVSSRADIAWIQTDIEAFIDAHEGQKIVVEWRTEP